MRDMRELSVLAAIPCDLALSTPCRHPPGLLPLLLAVAPGALQRFAFPAAAGP